MPSHLLAIGINYSGSQHALRGCINDARNWSTFFEPHVASNTLLLEQSATRAGIVSAIANLLGKLAASDTGIITFSGHGTHIPDQSGDEEDGRDEALCPFDLDRNLLLDDDLRGMLANRVAGSRVLLITDCCHSGTVTRNVIDAPEPRIPRYVPFADLTACMCGESLDRIVGQVRASRKRATIADQSSLVHLAGCKDNEVSYDATIAGQACGAFTYYALAALQARQTKGLTFGEWRDAVTPVRLPSSRYPQTPQFSGPLSLVVPGFEPLVSLAPVAAEGTLTLGGKVYDVRERIG